MHHSNGSLKSPCPTYLWISIDSLDCDDGKTGSVCLSNGDGVTAWFKYWIISVALHIDSDSGCSSLLRRSLVSCQNPQLVKVILEIRYLERSIINQHILKDH